jgi:hypothetical protein
MCIDRSCLGSCPDDADYSYISNAMIAFCFASWFDRESLEHFGARRLDHRPVSLSVSLCPCTLLPRLSSLLFSLLSFLPILSPVATEL